MDSRMDDVVLGCCVVCEKKCFKKVDNWHELSPEWASRRNIDYEKAHAAAGAGFKGMARLCFNCQTKKTKKRDGSGKNRCKVQCKGNTHKRKLTDVEETLVSSNLPVFVTCGVCKKSVKPEDFRRWYPCFSRAVKFDGFLEMACKGCTLAAWKKYHCAGGEAAARLSIQADWALFSCACSLLVACGLIRLCILARSCIHMHHVYKYVLSREETKAKQAFTASCYHAAAAGASIKRQLAQCRSPILYWNGITARRWLNRPAWLMAVWQ